MFYCNDCGVKRSWPIDTFMKSSGLCELCGKSCVCNDVPSKNLPVPDKEAPINQNWEKMSREMVCDQADIVIELLTRTKDMIHSGIFTEKGLIKVHANLVYMIASSETLFLEHKEQRIAVPDTATEALKKLLDFIDKEHPTDCEAYDGDGHVDTWQSDEFEAVIENAKEVIPDDKEA